MYPTYLQNLLIPPPVIPENFLINVSILQKTPAQCQYKKIIKKSQVQNRTKRKKSETFLKRSISVHPRSFSIRTISVTALSSPTTLSNLYLICSKARTKSSGNAAFLTCHGTAFPSDRRSDIPSRTEGGGGGSLF